VLDGALAGRQYLLGNDFTIADLNVAALLSGAMHARLDLSAPLAAGLVLRMQKGQSPTPRAFRSC
jgi:glutathione S-transferase